jgi:AcrR family transcriptional regulator
MSKKIVRHERRLQILEALHQCLLEKPFYQTSIKDIALRAKVNHGLLHYYFENKEDILLQYIEYTFDHYFTLFEERFTTRFKDVEIDIKSFEAQYLWMMNEIAFNKESARIFTEIWALSLYNHKIMDKLRNHYQHWQNRIFSLVGNFVKDEMIARQMSLTLIAFSEGMSLFSIFFKREDLCMDMDFKGLLDSLSANSDIHAIKG